ncbi:MAG: hypothetical protein R3A10_12535 [Caldilineaceae bacterium]
MQTVDVALVPMGHHVVGTSRRLSVSLTSAISIITGTALLGAVGSAGSPDDYIVPAITLALLVGLSRSWPQCCVWAWPTSFRCRS